MDISRILSSVDHTLLMPGATWAEITETCDDGILYETASVCIPAGYLKQAKNYTKGKIRLCTVIGFPNGNNTTAVKCFEAFDAVNCGADEIDMVINIGWLKDKRYCDIYNEIRSIKQICGDRILKVIVETCLLTREEKIRICETVSNSGADYIKTSTGFSTGGANIDDVKLFAEHKSPSLKIKASGGVSTLEDAAQYLESGASRLGSSKIVRLVKAMELKKENGPYEYEVSHASY